jgi:chromosome segregation ATPase
MQLANQQSERRLIMEIDELRPRFPRTQDLYREVCVLLFFHHGITPTVNKLYQLVRKGSMSAPTEALNQFWKTLRERSRVTIDHADLPEELRAAAGDLVATLWKSAQSKSDEALAALRAEAVATIDSAKVDAVRAKTAQVEAIQALERIQTQLRVSEDDAKQLRLDLAAAAATRKGLEQRLEDARHQLHTLQARMDQRSAEHVAEREKLAERTRIAEERFADMEKRALVEIDRERTAATKLQNRLDAERVAHTVAIERLRSEHSAALATVGHLREQIGALQNAVDTLNNERNRERVELQSLRIQYEAVVRHAAADSARADHLRSELEQTRVDAAANQKTANRSKRRTRRSSEEEGT